MEQRQEVTFRRIRGRIVPIKRRDRDRAIIAGVVVGTAAAAGIALEVSRRKTVFKGTDFKIVRRSRIFSKTTSLTARTNIKSLLIGKAVLRPQRNRLFVESIFGITPKSNLGLLAQTSAFAKTKGLKTLTGNLTNIDLVDAIQKRGGTFTSLSKKGLRRVSAIAAKGEITRLQKGTVRALIRPLIKLKF